MDIRICFMTISKYYLTKKCCFINILMLIDRNIKIIIFLMQINSEKHLKIMVHKNTIQIQNKNPKLSYNIILQHPFCHSCIKPNQQIYIFKPNTTHCKKQKVCIVERTQQGIFIPKQQVYIETQAQTKQQNQIQTLSQKINQISNEELQTKQNLTNCEEFTPSKFIINKSEQTSLEKTNKKQIMTFYITKFKKFVDQKYPSFEQIQSYDIDLILMKLKEYEGYGQPKCINLKDDKILILSYFKSQLQPNLQLKSFIVRASFKKNDRISFPNKFVYYAITTQNHQLQKYHKFLTLPRDCQIRQLKLHSNWVFAITNNNIVCIHMKGNFDKICVIEQSNITTSFDIFPDKIIFVIYKYLHIYRIKEESINLEGIVKVKALQPYCFGLYRDYTIFGGINYQSSIISNNYIAQARELYFIKNFKDEYMNSKAILPNIKYHVCDNANKAPIQLIHVLPTKHILICCCQKTIYVNDLKNQGCVLNKIELSHHTKLQYFPFQFNMVNFIGIMDNYLMRVSIDFYGEQYGSEIKQYMEFGHLQNFDISHKQIYISDENRIQSCNLLDERVGNIIIQQQDTIDFFVKQGKVLVYILNRPHAYDFNYIQDV